jgi:RNA-dependent RNA polymerase
MKVPGHLSHEITVNLTENCIGHSTFTTLYKEGLAKCIGNLMKWDNTIELWKAVAHKGSVLAAQRAWEAGGESCTRGLGEHDTDNIESDDEDGLQQMENAIKQRSSAWWWDKLSSCPSSLEETVMVLLDVGFKPTDCVVLYEKLRKIVFTNIDYYTHKCKVNMPMSCTAFIVPGKTTFMLDKPLPTLIYSFRSLWSFGAKRGSYKE